MINNFIEDSFSHTIGSIRLCKRDCSAKLVRGMCLQEMIKDLVEIAHILYEYDNSGRQVYCAEDLPKNFNNSGNDSKRKILDKINKVASSNAEAKYLGSVYSSLYLTRNRICHRTEFKKIIEKELLYDLEELEKGMVKYFKWLLEWYYRLGGTSGYSATYEKDFEEVFTLLRHKRKV